MTDLSDLRSTYHAELCKKLIGPIDDSTGDLQNVTEHNNPRGREIAREVFRSLRCAEKREEPVRSDKHRTFIDITQQFLNQAFRLQEQIQPGKWHYAANAPTRSTDKNQDLAELHRIISQDQQLRDMLDCAGMIWPSIIISRECVSSVDENTAWDDGYRSRVESDQPVPSRGALETTALHASISCKWTVRSDRALDTRVGAQNTRVGAQNTRVGAQNTRTEALNLIRNRKGHLPHVMIVTAEPMPTRLASLALGTGDVDCVYHIALDELHQAIVTLQNEDQLDMLTTLIDGRRLRDISDLPLDLAI